VPGAERVFIGLGSNIEPEENFVRAIDLLTVRTHALALSPVYRTKAIGRPDQADYLNAVMMLEYAGEPDALKRDVLRPIEAELERRRADDPYAPRTIDLDILLFGERTGRVGENTLPDPDILERPFLARGILDIEPTLVYPGANRPLAQLVPSEAATLSPQQPFSSVLQHRLRSR